MTDLGVLIRQLQGAVAAVGDVTAFGKSLVEAANAAAARTLLGVDAAGAQRPPLAPENLRFVRGIVLSGGAIDEGSGFTVTHLSTGQYRITFATAFSDIPSVQLTGYGGTASATGVIARTAAYVEVATYISSTATLSNQDFAFSAIGPA